MLPADDETSSGQGMPCAAQENAASLLSDSAKFRHCGANLLSSPLDSGTLLSMGKSLVIVESPAKAKTINKYLGNQYVVKSSIGHIRDLPTSGSAAAGKEPAKRGKAAAEGLSPKEKAKRQLFARMGVDPEHGWKAKYEILPGKVKVIEEVRRHGAAAAAICRATERARA